MIPQTTELGQIQAAFIDKDNRIEELMRQINSAQSLLNSLKDTMNNLVGDGKITIQTYEGSNVGDFTVNQKEDKTITLPQQATVNNGTLTIQKNGTSVGTFTANQSGDTTANITVPTKTSEITNDSGFITAADLPVVNNATLNIKKNNTSIGTFTANAGTDVDINIPVPTAISELNNDSNFVSDANYVHTDNNFTNTDKAEIGKINNSLQFTYVVDSDQKLADWANNVSGNDYTSVLIRGQRTGTASVNLTAAGTKSIVGEMGSSITINVSSGVNNNGIYYVSIPTGDNYYIFNLNLVVNNVGNGQGLSYCVNIYNSSVTVDGASAAGGFRYCENIYNCKGVAVAHGSTGNRGNGFFACKNLQNCYGMGSATNNANANGFSSCENMINCICVGGSVRNNRTSYGVNSCVSVRYCQASGVTAAYYQSYSSPTADATYACANTLNGGWNTVAQ